MTVEHEPTKGARVAMGTTCECGKWFPSHNDYLKHVEEESMSYPMESE